MCSTERRPRMRNQDSNPRALGLPVHPALLRPANFSSLLPPCEAPSLVSLVVIIMDLSLQERSQASQDLLSQYMRIA